MVVYDPLKRLYNCARCQHTFTLIDEKYKPENIYIDEYFDSSHKNWFKNPNFKLFRYIHKSILEGLNKKDFKLLDLGCGRGDLLSFLRQAEPDAGLWGIDVSACKSNDFMFIQGDFMKIDVVEKFDAVVSLACIEHVENPDLFVKKIKDVVQPCGLVVIMTQNSGGMMYNLSKFLHKIGIHSGYDRLYSEHHIHHFTNHSLKLLLIKHGFKIKSLVNHNYDLASVDYPPAGPFITMLYKFLTSIVFLLSSFFKNGFLQTVVCSLDYDKG